MEKQLQLYGKVDKNGRPMISGNEKFVEYFKNWKNKSFIIEITVLNPGEVDMFVWYIIKMIVPAFIKGHKNHGKIITPQEATMDIIQTCPIFSEKDTLFDWNIYKPKCNMSKDELMVTIEWLHLYCLEHFDIVIGNIKTI